MRNLNRIARIEHGDTSNKVFPMALGCYQHREGQLLGWARCPTDSGKYIVRLTTFQDKSRRIDDIIRGRYSIAVKPCDYITVTGAAKRIGTRHSTIGSAIKRGELAVVETADGTRLLLVVDVQRWASQDRKPGRPRKQDEKKRRAARRTSSRGTSAARARQTGSESENINLSETRTAK
jgi:hypothetical protein